jgi:hypothetical protein
MSSLLRQDKRTVFSQQQLDFRYLRKIIQGEENLSIPKKGIGVAFSGGVIRRLNSTQWRNPIILERSRGGALATILRSDCTCYGHGPDMRKDHVRETSENW